MGIQVKHVCVVSAIFAVVGFGYVVGFAEIDPVRSPRAGALGAQPSVGRLIGNIRTGMATGQDRSVRSAADDLVRLYPDDPRSWLNRGYALRYGGGGVHDQEALECWERLLGMAEGVDFDALSAGGLNNALYLRGWAFRGLGRLEESRADFLRAALLTEQLVGFGDGGEIPDGAGSGILYNLACYWAMAGEFERAIACWGACVERGYDLNAGNGWWRVDPDFEDLWEDDRFWQIGSFQSAPQNEESEEG